MYEDLTVLENIRFFAEVRGLGSDDGIRAVCDPEFVGLKNSPTAAPVNLGGMKQKLGLASVCVVTCPARVAAR
jgi:ABC-type multidrug transport system ATPase subunit